MRFGGTKEAVHKDSPIEKVLTQFFYRRKSVRKNKGYPNTASTLSVSEFPDQVGSGLSGLEETIGSVGRTGESNLDGTLATRKRLVRVFELVELIVEREVMKMESFRPLFG